MPTDERLLRTLGAIERLVHQASGLIHQALTDDAPEPSPAEPEPPVCLPKALPDRVQILAAETARKHNPANAPRIPTGSRMFAAGEMRDEPLRIALVTAKYWGPATRQLSVSFMDPSVPYDLRSRILTHMNAWQCGVTFSLVDGIGLVRISLAPGGYWSYVGTDILHIAPASPTMNLQGFTMSTPESEYKRVIRHETGHCLVGDTLIDCPRDLAKYPLGIPIKDLVGCTPWVYAWENGQGTVKKAMRVWRTKQNVPVVRVIVSPGRGFHTKKYLPPQELVGTPDHRVLLADGKTWKALGALKPGDRLCSLYRSSNGRRTRIRWTGGERIREHEFVTAHVYGARPERHDSHHKDENQLNQHPDNLEWKDEGLHCGEHAQGRPWSEDRKAELVEANKIRQWTPETRAKLRQAHLGKVLSEATKAKMSATTKGRKQSEELIAKRAKGIQRFYANGGKSGMYGKTASEETRRKRSASMKATLARKKLERTNHVVVAVEDAGRQDVYDMTVPGAHSFVANGVVVHNSLGYPHEHMRQELVARIDRAKAYAWFQLVYGWPPATVDAQVLTPLDEASIMGTPADQTSIMCYMLPRSITKDGKPILGGIDINATDRTFAQSIYPLSQSCQASTREAKAAPPVEEEGEESMFVEEAASLD